MLRVRRSRMPDDWEKRNAGLSGRFLPLDPGDEAVLDVFEKNETAPSAPDDMYGDEGPPSSAYGSDTEPLAKRKWSKRSEDARNRWADPAFRKKMLDKRAEKRRKDEEAGVRPRHKIEIGVMDSITLCDDDKAKAINDYVRSNRLRSEKITAYHKDRRAWMETRLSQGEDLRWRMNRVEYKKQRQDKRQEEARRRHARMRAKRERQQDGEESLLQEDATAEP